MGRVLKWMTRVLERVTHITTRPTKPDSHRAKRRTFGDLRILGLNRRTPKIPRLTIGGAMTKEVGREVAEVEVVEVGMVAAGLMSSFNSLIMHFYCSDFFRGLEAK